MVMLAVGMLVVADTDFGTNKSGLRMGSATKRDGSRRRLTKKPNKETRTYKKDIPRIPTVWTISSGSFRLTNKD